MRKNKWFLLTSVAVLVGLLHVPQAAALSVQQVVAHVDEPIADPIPEDPIPSGLGLTVEEFATFPQSEPIPAPIDPRLMRQARINYIGEMPDGSGRRSCPTSTASCTSSTRTACRTSTSTWAPRSRPQFFSGRGLGQGFGFVTFHPDFRQQRQVLHRPHRAGVASATEAPDCRPSRTPSSTASSPSGRRPIRLPRTFAGTHREVLRIGFGGQIHGIQQIDFNPTAKRGDEDYGLLYLAVGDGGLGVGNNDPQNLAMPHGKMLRIDPRRRTAPTAGTASRPSTRSWAGRARSARSTRYGFRDPHRFSWDRRDGPHVPRPHRRARHRGDLRGPRRATTSAGASARARSSSTRAPANPCDRLLPAARRRRAVGYTYPVAAYDHNPPPGWNCTSDVGRGIAGGFVYRGHDVPALRGKYVFGDLVDGRVLYTEDGRCAGAEPGHDPPAHALRRRRASESRCRTSAGRRPRSTCGSAATPHGELYILAKANGKIWKVTGTRRFAGGDVGRTR